MSDEVLRWIQTETEQEEREGVSPNVRSFWFPAKKARGAVLCLHGGGGAPDDFRPLAAELNEAGYSVLCPLMPAHGRGPFELENYDFAAALRRSRHAWELLGGSGCAVIGQSLGGIVGIEMVRRAPHIDFVALAPVLRPRVGMRALGVVGILFWSPRQALASYRWQMKARQALTAARNHLEEVRSRLLVVHSRDDVTASFAGGQELYERAASPDKKFVPLEDQGHVLSLAPRLELVRDPIVEFLSARRA